ncbi:MAG: PilC/PilY family type IV pilus protein [Pseudomonadota bacterium]
MSEHQTSSSWRAGWRTAILCSVFTLCVGQTAVADDTEVFFGRNNGGDIATNPNVILILDSSGSMRSGVGGDPLGRTRQQVLQDVSRDFLNNLDNVNVGIMKFDTRQGDGDFLAEGGMVVHAVAPVNTSRGGLIGEINATAASGWTPLQETYLESAYYWMGERMLYGRDSIESIVGGGRQPRPSDPNSLVPGTDRYRSPIIGVCQRHYSVMITDGFPTRDRNGTDLIRNLLNDPRYSQHSARNCSNPDGLGGGGECLDELAEFLFENDFNASIPGKQNVVSNFIGFALDGQFLRRAAASGGGQYYTASTAESLREALGAIFNTVAEDATSFAAPSVSLNNLDRTRHRDAIYLPTFAPRDGFRWDGNLKRYRFAPNTGDQGMTVFGQDGQPAVNPATGFFYSGKDADGEPDPSVPTAWSFWSSAPDGDDVTRGGAAEQFTGNRNIVTNSGGNVLLSVNRKNGAMRSALVGRPIPVDPGAGTTGASNAVVDQWLDWAAGIDAFDGDEDGSTTDPRQAMGDPLHSQATIVSYGGGAGGLETVVFLGTNEGYLHAFDARNGSELSSFMPRRLWENIPYYAQNPRLGVEKRRYGMDGPITVWVNDGGDDRIDNGDKVIVYAGMRRGGRALYALDMTNPRNPSLLWSFSDADDGRMGQSWSKPVRAKLNTGTTASPNMRDVLIFAGGYDPSQDAKTNASADAYGNVIYIIDAETKQRIWTISNGGADTNVGNMVNSIPGAVRAIDLNLDGAVDRMYVIDVVGRLFRFDMHNETDFDITGGVIAELGGTAQGGGQNVRRFYYAPDVAVGQADGRSFLNITVSSGFRAKPLGTNIDDQLYAVRDYRPFEILGEDPADYSDYGIRHQDLVVLSGTSPTPVPMGAPGFRYDLPQTGEKSLAGSRIFNNVAYYTSYKPGSAPANKPCAPAVGSGSVYTIDLITGEVVGNGLNQAGIPPEVTFLFGQPPEGEQGIDNCFGRGCPSDPTDPANNPPPNCPAGDPNCGFQETQNEGTRVQCRAGMQSCDTGQLQRPTRTYWRQLNEDD